MASISFKKSGFTWVELQLGTQRAISVNIKNTIYGFALRMEDGSNVHDSGNVYNKNQEAFYEKAAESILATNSDPSKIAMNKKVKFDFKGTIFFWQYTGDGRL